jgi:hypothetical protein
VTGSSTSAATLKRPRDAGRCHPPLGSDDPVRSTRVIAEELVGLLTGRGFSRGYGEFLAQALGDVAAQADRCADALERAAGRARRRGGEGGG